MRTYADKMLNGFEDELKKIANTAKVLVPAAAGSVLTLAAIRANNDRKMGKQLRLQQQGY